MLFGFCQLRRQEKAREACGITVDLIKSKKMAGRPVQRVLVTSQQAVFVSTPLYHGKSLANSFQPFVSLQFQLQLDVMQVLFAALAHCRLSRNSLTSV